jgi:hypothetical protein
LDGASGTIVAENIELGSGAVITDKITFTDGVNNAYIYNPSKHNNKFIETKGLTINTDGTACLGKIEVNGEKSTIIAKND